MCSPAWLTISWQQLQHHCWLAREPQRPTCLLLPGTGITRMGHHTQLFYEGWGIRRGSSCTLSTELSPQPQSHNSVCPSVIFFFLPHLFYFVLFSVTTPNYLPHNVHQNISSIYRKARKFLPFFWRTLSLNYFRKRHTATILCCISQKHHLRVRPLPWQFSKLIWVRITTAIVSQSLPISSLQRACLFI